jgi:hypothetical protein
MIETNQRIIVISNEGGEGKEGVGGIKPTIKRHLELQEKTLQIAARDADKLEHPLKVKAREKEQAKYVDVPQRLVTGIEMLEVIMNLISTRRQDRSSLTTNL